MEKQIVETLWNGDSEAQIQAAMELSRLCNKKRHNLAESGVMVPLVSMLHSGNYEAIEASLCALLSLSFGSERLVHSFTLNIIIQCKLLQFNVNFFNFFSVQFPRLFIVHNRYKR